MSKVVLITGAAKRTGRVIAEYLSAKGFNTVVHYGTSATQAQEVVAAIKQQGREAIALSADLTDTRQIRKLINTTYQHFGTLDLLVNCASVFEQDHFSDFSVEKLDLSWMVNCRAPILLTKSFYDKAKALGTTGIVINIVDQKVKENFHHDHFCYTVGKTALGQLTKMLTICTHPVLRVNAIFPGLLLPSDDQTLADFKHASQHAAPLGRIATPEDIAQAIEFLNNPAYRGIDLIIDGGQNLVPVTQDVLYQYRAPSVDAS